MNSILDSWGLRKKINVSLAIKIGGTAGEFAIFPIRSLHIQLIFLTGMEALPVQSV